VAVAGPVAVETKLEAPEAGAPVHVGQPADGALGGVVAKPMEVEVHAEGLQGREAGHERHLLSRLVVQRPAIKTEASDSRVHGVCGGYRWKRFGGHKKSCIIGAGEVAPEGARDGAEDVGGEEGRHDAPHVQGQRARPPAVRRLEDCIEGAHVDQGGRPDFFRDFRGAADEASDRRPEPLRGVDGA